jgi:hypothetical protein
LAVPTQNGLIKDNYMADEVKKVDPTASAGAEVKKEDAAASPAGGIDLADTLMSTLDKLEKSEKERENYRIGMLKAKGKVKDDAGEDEEKDTEAQPVKVAATESSEIIGIAKQLIKRNQELETAMLNKSQIANSPQGGSSETVFKVGDNMLSEAQIGALKAKGWDDKKISRFKENLLKVRA